MENIYEKNEVINCDFCKSNENFLVLKSTDYFFDLTNEEFNVVQCKNCNLIFTNPRPTLEELNRMYSETLKYGDQIEHKFDQKNRFHILNRIDLLTDYFNYSLLKPNRFRKIIQYPNYLLIRRKWKYISPIPKYIPNGKILEIGSSYGDFLYILKKLGWNVKGIEINNQAVDYSVNKLHLDVVNQNIYDFEPNYKFDNIYLRMTLEHLNSPKKALEKCHSLLKPNGKIIIIIPDFSGFEQRIYKKYAYTLQVPYHLYHFTPKTIKNYLKEINFKKIKCYHDNFERDLIVPLNFIIRENPNKNYIKYIKRILTHKLIKITFVKILLTILSRLEKTSRMTIIAEK